MSKQNINLPKTIFSMKANLQNKEPGIVDYWDKIELYKKLRSLSKGKEKFVLHDGPPYANGNIHMGTALNKILKDLVVKFHQMSGKDSVYVPGWDCHGLPIEWKIEEQYKKNKKDKNEVPINEFRNECRDFATKWIDVHKKQFKRLGVIGDWENYYSTMSFDAEAQIVRELGKFLKEGSMYRGYKPVLWSTVEKTALADAEVEYLDHKSDTIFAAFQVKKSKIDKLKNSEIIIWTTTPWTIPANRALAYNENLKYAIINIEDQTDFKDKQIVVAEDSSTITSLFDSSFVGSSTITSLFDSSFVGSVSSEICSSFSADSVFSFSFLSSFLINFVMYPASSFFNILDVIVDILLSASLFSSKLTPNLSLWSFKTSIDIRFILFTKSRHFDCFLYL